MMKSHGSTISVNGRIYMAPERPTVVICLDGSEPGYIEKAIEAGMAPTFARFMKDGTHVHANCVIPSFTNPNNLSIITGRPPAVHGIAGNYFYDTARDAEVMMNDPRFLRAPTILAAVHNAGYKVVTITAKDKLRALLSDGLDYSTGRAIAFSSEKADQASIKENGIGQVLEFVGQALPEVYSADLSRFAFAAGVKLLEVHRPDLMYLSTTDYIQHKVPPGAEIANRFYGMIDGYLAWLDALGCNIVATADHGMNDKHLANGAPDVIYLQDLMDEWIGKGKARVILPITDPYVAHHGSLGSFATVYIGEWPAEELLQRLRLVHGVDLALMREEACAQFELPPDRIGDIVVLSSKHKVLGSSRGRHDLSSLHEPLRSHGGLTEQRVPLISNRKIALPPDYPLRNFDAFDVALNRIQ
ncbi:phosphonoacetate hydrolase [Bradyrhizobium diazoefficiens]|uniref:phosphonoacetate hydrolase n=1 Tax=Bradyrhizobium diazoefficiens TaxID=1355477 RepID=UPI003D9B5F92